MCQWSHRPWYVHWEYSAYQRNRLPKVVQSQIVQSPHLAKLCSCNNATSSKHTIVRISISAIFLVHVSTYVLNAVHPNEIYNRNANTTTDAPFETANTLRVLQPDGTSAPSSFSINSVTWAEYSYSLDTLRFFGLLEMISTLTLSATANAATKMNNAAIIFFCQFGFIKMIRKWERLWGIFQWRAKGRPTLYFLSLINRTAMRWQWLVATGACVCATQTHTDYKCQWAINNHHAYYLAFVTYSVRGFVVMRTKSW